MAKKTPKNTQKTKSATNTRRIAGESSGLVDRCQQIGISAVAAAVRYQGVAKNPAYAPASINWRDRAEDTAA
jgi:hypothetical protein